jgi:hypothetical protein
MLSRTLETIWSTGNHLEHWKPSGALETIWSTGNHLEYINFMAILNLTLFLMLNLVLKF